MRYFKYLLALICTITTMSCFAANQADESTNEINYSADNVQAAANNKGTMLKGNVLFSIGDNIKVTANKMFVKYIDHKNHQVAECTIYGKGTFDDGQHTMEFVDGTFNPKTLKITAKEIKTIR